MYSTVHEVGAETLTVPREFNTSRRIARNLRELKVNAALNIQSSNIVVKDIRAVATAPEKTHNEKSKIF